MGRRCAALSDRHRIHAPQGHQAKDQRQYHSLSLVDDEEGEAGTLPRVRADSTALLPANCPLHLHLREPHAQDLATGRQVHLSQVPQTRLPVFHICFRGGLRAGAGAALRYSAHQDSGKLILKQMNTE